MTMQEAAYAALKRASGGEWVEAGAVRRQMAELPDVKPAAVPATNAAMGRLLAQLVENGYGDRKDSEGASLWRVRMAAVTVYDGEAQEAGRILLAQTAAGLDIDLSQLAELLPTVNYRLVLGDRDVRTLRAACDETLITTGGWR